MFFLIPGCGSQLFHKMSCKWEVSLEASCPWKVVLNFLIRPSFKSSNKYFGGMPLLWFCSLANICTGIHPCLLAANVKWVKAGIRSSEGCLVTVLNHPLRVIVAMMESTSWEVEGWFFLTNSNILPGVGMWRGGSRERDEEDPRRGGSVWARPRSRLSPPRWSP